MFFLALRHLFSRRKQSLLTLLGIILGTAAYIAISAMMLGFQTFIIDQLINNDSHIRIQAREEVLTDTSLNAAFFPEDTLVHWLKPPSGRKDNAYILAPGQWISRLEADSRVAAVSPQLVLQGIATYGRVALGVSILGVEPEKQQQVTNIAESMVSGQLGDIGTSGNRIAVGDEFLKKIGAAKNETIFLTVGKGLPQAFRIVAIFHLGVKAFDETRIFASLNDVQRLNHTPSRISDIALRLNNVERAAEIATTYNLLGPEKVQSWDQANEGIMSVFATQDMVRNFMTISILVVAGFGIYNILSLAVSHKRREIAILRSMGFEPSDITRLFLIQGIILGFIGGLVGMSLGLVASYVMSKIEISGSRGLGGNHLIISYLPLIYVKAFLLALFSASFASFFPARSAGKLEPIDIIRGENS